ncbi:hypothetical protein OBBRIDRAFT_722201 [Obba rivulosa]|uniref:DRBM domain-containing protein n=1 Tax=Obba rivulosa TaxID=1052685 RepID=A0A8E2DRZ5_9APHY|nr:hypothetical protein OBBRIDRAFT_722201 [Obba rivulosa]
MNTVDTLPPAPKLRGEIILDVFTHHSLRFAGAPINEDSEYGDNERLAYLGEKVLDAAVTWVQFCKRPMLRADELDQQRREALSDEKIESWVVGYKFKEKVRCSADALPSLNTPQEMRTLFSSYVGAVYAQNGMNVAQNWIASLIDPNYEPPLSTGYDQEHSFSFKKVKTESMMSTPPPQPGTQAPPPPMNPPPPLPNPLAPAQPSAAFLPLFNQTANQRRLVVEYPAQFSGPAHAGRWTVQCIVNGIEKGTGTGASKQLAKEEAARQAYYAMGWAPRT